MTLTAPAVLDAGMATVLEASIWFPIVIVLAFLAFCIGHLTGRIEMRVRAAEDAQRHAARPRHPSARPQSVTERPTRTMTHSEWEDWGHRFSEALRAAGGYTVPVNLSQLAGLPVMLKPDKRMVCGQPSQTSLGTVRCLARPGHPGRC